MVLELFLIEVVSKDLIQIINQSQIMNTPNRCKYRNIGYGEINLKSIVCFPGGTFMA